MGNPTLNFGPSLGMFQQGAAIAILILSTCSGAHAQDPIDYASSQTLTLGGAGILRGEVRLGTLSENQSLHGFALDLFQMVIVHERQVQVQGESTYETIQVPVYGWLPGSQYWVEDYGYVEQYVERWVEPVYDWVVVGSHYEGGYDGYWNDNGTPEDGSDDYYVEGSPGTLVDDYGYVLVSGGYYETVTEWVWTMTGGHYETGPDVWGITSYDTQTVEIPTWEWRTETTHEYGVPTVRLTGTKPAMTWIWRNVVDVEGAATLDIMRLAEGGLTLPMPGDATGAFKALAMHSKFEQSWSRPSVGSGGAYDAVGSRMGRETIEVWKHEGSYVSDGSGGTLPAVAGRRTVKLAPGELTVEMVTSSTSSGQTANIATRIGATSSTLEGMIIMRGAFRVVPG